MKTMTVHSSNTWPAAIPDDLDDTLQNSSVSSDSCLQCFHAVSVVSGILVSSVSTVSLVGLPFVKVWPTRLAYSVFSVCS